MEHKHTNALIHSTSPYLQQHAHNPVNWHEWGDEALALAQSLDKPILVSIGYSSCHWCHVMERESFEAEDIARIMNDAFVCIKVDREERPDIDQVYMEAVQALGVHGGWPLNVFLTSGQKPFFGGTYFSPPAWTQVLQNVARAYAGNRDQIEDTAEELTQHLMRSDIGRFVQPPDKQAVEADLSQLFEKLAARFDRRRGGMENVPKFIMPSIWRFLLQYHYITKHETALSQVVLTLDKVAQGGIYDQLGGGFARYSVDGEWFAPHFEKMLYDNAQLLSLYSEAFAVTGNGRYKRVVYETFAWLQREMTDQNGGFYSALDADSEGVEGKYYCWTQSEIEDVLGPAAHLFCDYYHVTPQGNWEHGMNILYPVADEASFLDRHRINAEQWDVLHREAREKLLTIREARIRPGLDDKILTAWNAMTVCGLLDAYAAFEDQQFLDAARRNLAFIAKFLSDDKVLFRSWKEKRSVTKGFLDDYAYYILALLKMYSGTFDESVLLRAADLLREVMAQFFDANEKYFFYTSDEAERLIARKKEIFDNVIPSSNAIMVQNLNLLGTLMDVAEWKEMAQMLTASLASLITSEPSYMSQWAIVLAGIRAGFKEVVLTGNSIEAMRKDLQRHFTPFAVFLGTRGGSDLPLLADKQPIDGRDTIFVCENKVCQLPVHSPDAALQQIKTWA